MDPNGWNWKYLMADSKTFKSLEGTKGINETIHVHLDGRINRWEGLCQTTTTEYNYTCKPYESEVFGRNGNHCYKQEYTTPEQWRDFWAWVNEVLTTAECVNVDRTHCDGQTASYRQDIATGHVF